MSKAFLKCEKVAYTTEEKAQAAFVALKMLAQLQKLVPPTKYYFCKKCHFWHITTH